MSTDYHPIKANEIIRGQVLLDRGSERKIVGIHKLPGRIYVYIQTDTTKAQLQFSPLEEVSVRNNSAKQQIFPDTFSNTPQPKTVENGGITKPHFPRSAFDLSDNSAKLSPHTELDRSSEVVKPRISDSNPYNMTEQDKQVLMEADRSSGGLYLIPSGDGTVSVSWIDDSSIDAPVFLPSPSPLQPSREHQKYKNNVEDFVRVGDRREQHNQKAIQVMRIGATIIFLGVLLTAFGMADGSDGAIVSWGVILAVIGGMIYTAGIFVAFFNPPYKRGHQVGELVEQLDTVRDFDWGIVVPALNLMSARTQAAPPTVVVNPLPQTTSISSDKGYQDEVQTMVMQQGQKTISGAAPPVKEKTNAVSLTGEAKSIHNNDKSKQIDQALEQIDMMGAIEATKNSPRAEKRTEDDNEEQPT